ncbi:MAG: SEC-C domain-containing protein [Gammaproteobacteria bacterium]|nr:SEC-C domain-containing protein [Gammaproteobacteria bacterium]
MSDRDAPVDLERLLPDAVAVGLRTQSWPQFHGWLTESWGHYAALGSGLLETPELQRAFGFALARALWNALPLPRSGFVPEPVPEPGRNDPCPCGSGQKYKRCCEQAPSLGRFDPAMLWPYVLHSLEPHERRAARAGRRAPREAILVYARDVLEAGHAAAIVELLTPEFEPEALHTDEIAGAMLLTLCDAHDARRGGAKLKVALLERMTRIPARSALRSDACQRLACIEMDRGRSSQAWQLFQQAQQDNPQDPALGMLEVQLLMGEGKTERARERARFHLGALRRRGTDAEPRLLEFYQAMTRDPARAMADVAMNIEGGVGERLGAWLDRVATRAVPTYSFAAAAPQAPAELARALRERLRQMGVRGAELDRAVADLERQIATMPPPLHQSDAPEPEDLQILTAPAPLDALEERWHETFPLGKPFSVHPLPADAGDVWEKDAEAEWVGLLEAHPEAFDSVDILDDLATAVMLHSQGNQPWILDRLLEPLLVRAATIVDAALAAAPGATLSWPVTEHRPVLRSLFRRAELEQARGNEAAALAQYERLLQLNPGDNHGVRFLLGTQYARRGDDAACVALAARYPEDSAPELRFNEALARYRLGQARSATQVLQRAHRATPRIAAFLLPARVRKPKLSDQGVTLDGPDRAWLYRDAMRASWQAAPGALAWVRKVTGLGGG